MENREITLSPSGNPESAQHGQQSEQGKHNENVEQTYADLVVSLLPYNITIDSFLIKEANIFSPDQQRHALHILNTIASRDDYKEGLKNCFISFRSSNFISADMGDRSNVLVFNVDQTLEEIEQQIRAYITTVSPEAALNAPGITLVGDQVPGELIIDPHKTVPLKLRHIITDPRSNKVTQKIAEPTMEFFQGLSDWGQFDSYVKAHVKPELHPGELLALNAYKQVLEQRCLDSGIGDGYIALTSPMSWQVASGVSLRLALERYAAALEMLIHNPSLQQQVAGKKLEFTFGVGAVGSRYAVIQLRETPEQTWKGFETNTKFEKEPGQEAVSPNITQSNTIATVQPKTLTEPFLQERLNLEARIAEEVAALAQQNIILDTSILDQSYGRLEVRRNLIRLIEGLRDIPQSKSALRGKRLTFDTGGPVMTVLEDGQTIQFNVNEPALALLIELKDWVQ